ncbi:MAG: NADP oxidoreductase [Gammaproteobacteria bacterium]|nr:NADP oxidoreductase [Gammaproteobacteria bacterium]
MAEANTPSPRTMPLRVAVVGSGPSGFYTTEALIKSGQPVIVDLFERLPAPYGLVRYGVAPDHPKLKQAIQVYEKIAQSPQFNFVGNVTVGRDLSVDELRHAYHAVVLTCGAEADRRLGVTGEDLPGSHTATEFVGWYNGHPDYRDRVFDLSHEVAVVIGQGNVAADVARVLAKTVDELRTTDIAAYALDVLAESAVREIHVIGRRGPAQAKFTPKELREFVELADCQARVNVDELDLNAASEAEVADKGNANARKNIALFQKFAQADPADKRRQCYFRFLKSPTALFGTERLEAVELETNRLSGEPFAQSAQGAGVIQTLDCGILFRSIGYRGMPMAGVPFDERRGVFSNRDGRIQDERGVVPGLYTAGWIKRGPTGIIGTNRADSVATVEALLADVEALQSSGAKPGADAFYPVLAERGVRVVSFSDWEKIDAAEIARGVPQGKPREKFARVEEMLSQL